MWHLIFFMIACIQAHQLSAQTPQKAVESHKTKFFNIDGKTKDINDSGVVLIRGLISGTFDANSADVMRAIRALALVRVREGLDIEDRASIFVHLIGFIAYSLRRNSQLDFSETDKKLALRELAIVQQSFPWNPLGSAASQVIDAELSFFEGREFDPELDFGLSLGGLCSAFF